MSADHVNRPATLACAMLLPSDTPLPRWVFCCCWLPLHSYLPLTPIFLHSQGVIETLAEVIPERQEMVKKLKAEHGQKSLGDIKVDNLLGGMRGLKVMLWEPSVLDANEGIRFWGRTIPECQEVLPKAPGGEQMLPESMLFYLRASRVYVLLARV